MMEKEKPMGWEYVKLGEISTIQSGGTPARGKSNYWGGDIPWVKISDLKEFYVSKTDEFITEEGLSNSSSRIFPSGTILFTIFASIGKIGVLKIDAATNQAVAGITPSKHLDWKFLTYSLLDLSLSIQQHGKGVAQKNINLTILKSTLIPIPPLPEQKRIVAKLDALFGHLDVLREKLDRIPELLKNFRQQVLTQAVTGKLTEEWRKHNSDKNSNDADSVNKQKHLIDEFLKKMTDIPEAWNWVALGNHAQCGRGKFSARPRNDPQFFQGDYPFIQIGNLPKNGGYIANHTQTLNEKGLKVSKQFPKGTVVIAIVGATIGNTGILSYDMCFPDSLVGMNTGNIVSNLFLEYYLISERNNIRQLSYAGGGQPNIKLPTLNNYPFPLASMEEQVEIVKRVQSLLSAADKIEAQYQNLKEKIDQLPQAILAKAFKGELVAQDENDEPAGVLLERIKDKKAGKGSKKAYEQESPDSYRGRMVAEEKIK